MAIVAAVIGSALSGVASAVGAVVGAITSTVGAAVAGVVATVGSVVAKIATTLATTLGPVIKAVTGITQGITGKIEVALNTIRTTVAEPFAKVVESLKGGITEVAKAITTKAKPILDPIKDTLTTIHDYMAATNAWVKKELKPIADLVGFINDISALMVVKRLLFGTADIAGILGDIERESGLATAKAIAILYRDTAQIATDTLSIMRNHYTRLAETIEEIPERITQENKLAVAYVEESLKGELKKVTDPLYDRVGPLELEVAAIERRTEDLPFFAEMVIRTLR